MELAEAQAIIDKANLPSDEKGYLVSFEEKKGGCLHGNHFPDVHAGEEPIKGLETAWQMAREFAHATGNEIVNVYVVHGEGSHRFVPVEGYKERKLKPYTPG